MRDISTGWETAKGKSTRLWEVKKHKFGNLCTDGMDCILLVFLICIIRELRVEMPKLHEEWGSFKEYEPKEVYAWKSLSQLTQKVD